MLRRRLFVLAVVLLATGVVAAALTPRDMRQGAGTTPTAAVPPPPAGATGGTAADEESVHVVDASARQPAVVRVRRGTLVRLRVRAPSPDEVELVGLGRFEAVDQYSPARFDFFAERRGSFPIRLREARRDVGRLVVDAPPL